MTLLITRPEADAAELAGTLRARGHAVVTAPMLDVVYLDGPDIALRDYDGILATSANGVRALARRTADRARPLFAVGDATAAEAGKLGFETVESAAGDVQALADMVLARCDGSRRFLHVAGSAVAGDLAARLAAGGHAVERAQLYEARMRDALDDGALAALSGGAVDGVLVFSPRTAQAFAAALRAGPGAGAVSGAALFALSPAVAEASADLPWRAVHVAARPDTASLLGAVDAAFAKSP